MKKCVVVAGGLEALLRRGSGALLPTERELAAEFGVSRTTIREALALLEARGVARKVPGRGYLAARSVSDARGRPRSHRKVIGYPHWVGALSEIDVFAVQARLIMLDAIRAELGRFGIDFDPQPVGPEADPDRVAISRFCREWDGVILEPPEMGGGVGEDHPFAPMRDKMVVIGNVQNGHDNCIRLDFYNAARQAMKYLADTGARRVLYTGSECERNCTHLLSLLGAESVLAEDPRLSIDYGRTKWSVEDGYHAVLEAVRAGRRFDAVLANSGYACIGVYRGLHEAGLSVPEDVQVVTIAGLPAVRYLVPRPAVLEIDINDIGRQAARMVRALVLGRSGPQASRLVSATLVPGESTRSAAVQIRSVSRPAALAAFSS
jgi:DNA-binding LacI/PurR family transcriptional regulator